MTLHDRYIKGDCVNVWNEINNLYFDELTATLKEDVLKVINMTVERVKYNVESIACQLLSIGYITNIKDVISYPTLNQQNELKDIQTIIEKYGYLPLLLISLYKVIDKIDFVKVIADNSLFDLSDPLYIESIHNELSILDESWEEISDEKLENNLPIGYPISPDLYHKNNISGGLPYEIEISKHHKIDSLIFNTPYCKNIYFVDYLRLCFSSGGFPSLKNNKKSKDLIVFLSKKLLPI